MNQPLKLKPRIEFLSDDDSLKILDTTTLDPLPPELTEKTPDVSPELTSLAPSERESAVPDINEIVPLTEMPQISPAISPISISLG